MNSYIIINGINSNTITGLLIQELPPISKPKMRNSVEEIDGKDGNIVTKLGYSAYTKTFSIGLYGNYDIDEVISFFNNEGTITFSNESDKYYNFQILEQIDFEKLIKFKTAKIKILVQPFKYSIVEHEIESSDTTITINNSGNINSRPIFTIYGENDISVYLNNFQIFQIALDDNEYITIDTENMNAYKNNILKNRIVTGNYSNFALLPGENIISLNGNVTNFKIDKYSRWL